MTDKPVVLRYEDDWEELRAQIDADRTAGLVSSPVRDALHGWYDEGSFVEVGTLARRSVSSYRGGDDQADEGTEVAADGVVAGWGRRNDVLVFVSADDPTLGSDVRGAAGASKAQRVREHALAQSAALLQILAAKRIDDDVFLGAEFARFGYGVALDFERESSERILKIVIVTGPLTEQAAVEATWGHIVILAGPEAALFGCPGATAVDTGLADWAVPDLGAALDIAGAALDHLPPSAFDEPPTPPPSDRWNLALASGWQTDTRTGFEVVGRHTIGRAEIRAERLDAARVRKVLRLARFCDAFRLPLVIDHTGFTAPAPPATADLDALAELGEVLTAAATPVLEVARTSQTLTSDLRVTPTWSAGSPDADLAHTVGRLPVHHPRPDQDARIAQLRPPGLQGAG